MIPGYLHDLSGLRFSTVETAAAVGTPVPRLAQRIKEGRVPQFAAHARHATPGRGRQRSFSLVEVYALRVVEELSGGDGGIDVASATAILDRLRGAHVLRVPEFEHLMGWHPQTWPAEWLVRDLAAPVYVAAALVPTLGWRASYANPGDSLTDVLNRFDGRPEWRLAPLDARAQEAVDGAPMPPARMVLVNLTRALVAVDAALSPLLDQQA